MAFLLTLHGEIRWLVALVAVIAVVKFALGWLTKMKYQRMDRGLIAAYTGLLDLNLLLGLIILLFGGGISPARLEHAGTMFVAIVIAHSAAAWRKSTSARNKFRNNLIIIVVSFALVVVGVIRLRGGWIF